jgi:hypothetical protein
MSALEAKIAQQTRDLPPLGFDALVVPGAFDLAGPPRGQQCHR